MKTINKIIIALASVAAFIGCTQEKAEFVSYSFVTFNGSSYTVAEDTVKFVIPVQVYPKVKNDVTVTVAVLSGATATVGTDYTIDNEVLTFKAGEDNVKDVVVNVVNHAGVYTNTLGFNLGISQVVGDNVYTGTNDVVKVTITDLDHPLSAILGDYGITGVFFNSNNAYYFTAVNWTTITLSSDSKDVTKVWFSSLSPIYSWYATGGGQFYGIVSADMKTITVPFGQTSTADYGDGVPVEVALLETIYVSGSGVTPVEPKTGDAIVFTRTEDAGVVYSTNADWDLWDMEAGSPVAYNAPVLGNKWAPLFGAPSFATVITKQ